MASEHFTMAMPTRSASYMESVAGHADLAAGEAAAETTATQAASNAPTDDDSTHDDDTADDDDDDDDSDGPPSLLAGAGVVSRWTYLWMTPFVRRARKGNVRDAVHVARSCVVMHCC